MTRALSEDDRRRLEDLFERAADLPPAERDAFVERECGTTGRLRAELCHLLEGLGGEDVLERLRTEAPTPAGTRIGPYRLLERLGAGGVGEVYAAVQDRPLRTVALKLLRPECLTSETRRRFQREGEFLGWLEHPGIARIFDSGTASTDRGPRPYFAMELVQGEPLTDHAWRRQLSTDERIELLIRVAEAVQHAHQHSLIHRDLKPANILVESSGQPKVLDFGIARLSDSDVRLTTLHTGVGQILGTLAYMSPEQTTGDPSAIDPRSDVYSMGVLAFELLAHRLPYDVSGKTLPDAVRTIQEEEPPRLSAVDPEFSGDLEVIVGKALEKEKERRYPSAAALISDLRCFLRREPVAARPPSRLYSLRKFVRRNKTVVAAVLAFVVALLVGLTAAVWIGIGEAEQRRLAQAESYRGNLTVTLEALEEGNYAAARDVHDRAPESLRGWEWHHLNRRWVRELARVTVPDVAFAAPLDETRYLAVDRSVRVHVWDALTGELTLEASWPPGTRPLALTEDGRWLLACAADELLLGDPRSAEPAVIPLPRQTPVHGAGLSAVAPDGSRAAVVIKGNHVLIAAPDQALRSLPYDAAEVLSVAFDPAGRRLAVRRRGRLRLWDADSLEVLWEERVSYGGFAFSPDGNTFAAEVRDDTGAGSGLFFKEAASGRNVRFLPRERYGAYHLARSGGLVYSGDQRLLALTFTDRGIFLLDANAGRPSDSAGLESGIRRSDPALVGFAEYGPTGDVLVALSPRGDTLMSLGVYDQTLRLWRTGVDGASHACRGNGGPVDAVAFSRDGARIASGTRAGSVALWDAASGEPDGEFTTGGPVGGLAFLAGGQLVAQVGDRLVLWDTNRGRLIDTFPGEYAGAVACSADGSVLAAATREGRVRTWDVGTRAELSVLECGEGQVVSSLAFGAGGRWLAAGSSAASVTLWETDTWVRRAHLTTEHLGSRSFRGALSIAFDPEGERLVVGWGDSCVSILDVASWTELRKMHDHRGEVFAVAYSPDGARIASGGVDGALRLWDGRTGDRLLALEEHGATIRALAFSPDGARIVSGSEDTTARIWDSEPVTARWNARKARASIPVEADLHERGGDEGERGR